MKSHLLPALKLTFVCMLFFAGVYTLIIWFSGLALAPNAGKGEIIYYSNVPGQSNYGYVNIGQSFTEDHYFWSRPSAVGYNAAGSGASNKGPGNEDYLELVQARIDSFLAHNPTVKKSDIPVELITASGSGLDPHLSPKAALVQVSRIANIRKLPENKIIDLINEQTEKPLFGLFGPPRINVLKLNLLLNNLK